MPIDRIVNLLLRGNDRAAIDAAPGQTEVWLKWCHLFIRYHVLPLPIAFPLSNSRNLGNMVSIMVTGTNQGIGFGLVRELVKRSDVDQIFATARDPNSAACADLVGLQAASPKLHIIKLELNEESAAV